jgi:hypothetical protein
MPSCKFSLTKEITDTLQDCLPEFSNGKKAKRKELLDKILSWRVQVFAGTER